MVIKKNQEPVDTLLIFNLITGSKINNWLRVVCIFIIDLTYYVSTSQTSFVDFKGLLVMLGIMWLNKYVDSSIVAWVFLHCCSLFLALLLDSFCIVGWLLLCCYFGFSCVVTWSSHIVAWLFKSSCIIVQLFLC
jgi:hypothetical protein